MKKYPMGSYTDFNKSSRLYVLQDLYEYIRGIQSLYIDYMQDQH